MRILEMFDSLQGEGVWSGTPMTFVRLAGCNAAEEGLDCIRWCDTPEGHERGAGSEAEAGQIAEAVRLPRVCLTGGEPLVQGGAVTLLTQELRARGRTVHMETNGTLSPPDDAVFDWVTVSPKPPDYRVAKGLGPLVEEVKLVVDSDFRVRIAEELSSALPHATVCLQPEAGAGPESLRRAVQMVLGHPDWRLSVQLHKLIGIP